jgi:hypothetical protein
MREPITILLEYRFDIFQMMEMRIFQFYHGVVGNRQVGRMLDVASQQADICKHMAVVCCKFVGDVARVQIMDEVTHKMQRRPISDNAVERMPRLKTNVFTHDNILLYAD